VIDISDGGPVTRASIFREVYTSYYGKYYKILEVNFMKLDRWTKIAIACVVVGVIASQIIETQGVYLGLNALCMASSINSLAVGCLGYCLCKILQNRKESEEELA
jgi:hypothetical protein